jgi:eukaryotic-like serine/threonine-protein kinase
MADDTLPFGTTLSHYTVVARLGAGGMGVVYRARDGRLDRDVALKVLPPEFAADPERLRRFEREARAASALSHPGVAHIYDIGEAGGVRYIAMEYVEGRTLQDDLADGPLPTDRLLEIGVQVADALGEAHARGIVHRDVKPGNIMTTPRGQVKVLDFGLAKLVDDPLAEHASDLATLSRTASGVILGTVPYMSPEQVLGREVDPRTDVFALGAVLYEMATGTRPFAGSTVTETMDHILHSRPEGVRRRNAGRPAGLETVIERCLEKDPASRYPTASGIAFDLRRLGPSAASRWRAPRRWLVPLIAAAVAAGAAGIVLQRRAAHREWALRSVPRVEELARAGKHADAYDLALRVRDDLRDPATVERFMPEISDLLSVSSEPPGARVYLRRASPEGPESTRQLVGTTPIEHLRVARSEYVLTLEKESCAPLERLVSSRLSRAELEPGVIEVKTRLGDATKVPDGMVFVPGGDYKLVGWGRATNAQVHLDDFLIDRFEVTNRAYGEFVAAGGYLKKDLWKRPFEKDGRPVSWEEGVRGLKDRVGLPGPRGWSNQSFLEGKAEHPVADVTWYEAAAYCAFRGKSLPTLFQWEKAARDGIYPLIGGMVMPWGVMDTSETVLLQRANFQGKETTPVSDHELGISPYGCHHMAGNVAEWCRNEQAPGFAAAGGSWNDLPYRFAEYSGFPASYSAPTLGFRCARTVDEAATDQGSMRVDPDAEIPVFTPNSEAAAEDLKRHYVYDRPALDAEVVEAKEAPGWRREKIRFRGARDQPTLAYLYLPRNFPRPLQVLHYVPSYGAFMGTSVTDEIEFLLKPFLLGGRAVFSVVLEGYVERSWPAGHKWPSQSSVRFRDQMVAWITDLRRGLDYLETRHDLDARRIAFGGTSFGISQGLILTAIESRYRAAVLWAGGAEMGWSKSVPEANPLNFAAHIRVPKLMINGRYDEEFRFNTQIVPLFKLLRDPKRHEVFDSGHVPPQEQAAPVVNAFLDQTLDPVPRE